MKGIKKTQEVILYLMHMLGGHVESRMKLIKLLYFIDKEAKEKLSSKITGATYIYHYYGQYSKEIIHAIQELKDNGKITEIYVPDPGRFEYLLAEKRTKFKLSDREKAIINKVLKEYGDKDSLELKKIAYEDLKNKRPGEVVL